MTMVEVGNMCIPTLPQNISAAPNVTSVINLDAVNDAIGNVFQIGKAGTISQISFYNSTLAGSSGSFDLEVRLETVDTATGLPTGTLWATNTKGTVNVLATADNQWQTITLTATGTVSKGQFVAVVAKVTAINGAATTMGMAKFADTQMHAIYGVENLTGAGWAKNSVSNTYNIVPIFNDGSLAETPSLFVASAVNTRTFNSGSSPSKRAMKFKVAAPMRLTGCWVWLDLDADCIIKLYAADGTTVLAQKTVSSNIDNASAAWIYTYLFDANEVSPGYYDLVANTNYYLSIEPSSGSDISIYDVDYPSNAYLGLCGGGINWYSSTNTGGTWTDNTLNRPWIGLIFNGVDDGVSAGGFYFYSL